MPSLRVHRALRGGSAASMATGGALLSHLAGGGAMPHWQGIIVPLLVSVLVCTVLAGRALSVVRLSAAVALSQWIFHTLFVLGATPTGTTTPTSTAPTTDPHAGHGSMTDSAMSGHVMAGHSMPGTPMAGNITTATTMPASGTSDAMATMLHSGVGMWLWHGIAAVITIAILHRGERTLLDLHVMAHAFATRARRALVPAMSVPVAIPETAARIPAAADAPVAVDEPFMVSVGRRGPPVLRILPLHSAVSH